MGAACIGWPNAADGAALTPSGEVGDLAAANVQNPIIGKVWRAMGTAPWLQMDMGAPAAVRMLAVIGCTLAATDTIRWRGSLLAPGGDEVFDTGASSSGVADGYGLALSWLAAAVTVRYLRLDIDAPSRASVGYVDVGRVFAGPAIQPAINMSLGWQESWRDASRVTVAEKSGAQYIDPGPRAREVNGAFNVLTAAERAALKEVDRAAGVSGQVLFIPNPEGDWAREGIFGRMADMSPIAQPYSPIFTKSYRIVQSL